MDIDLCFIKSYIVNNDYLLFSQIVIYVIPVSLTRDSQSGGRETLIAGPGDYIQKSILILGKDK